MGATHPHITEELREFIEAQHLFFVATAPAGEGGHVNVSPKGLDTFRVLSGEEVAYLDLTGSGNETSAHVLENGRITFMFCAFKGSPKILRLYGTADVVLPETPAWEMLRPKFGASQIGERQIVHARITRVQTSCGYGVPRFEYTGDREQLTLWAEQAEKKTGLENYRVQKNSQSIDGLPTHFGTKRTR
jgi:hypothetical protein